MFGTLTTNKKNRALEPWRRLEQEMETMLDRVWGPEGWFTGEAYMPHLNLAETETAYEVTVDLPGVKPEDLTVELKQDQLWITGEKKEEKEERGKTFHRVERHVGQFRRVVPLPGKVAEAGIEAEFTGGVLKVRVPKTAEAQPKHIAVKTT